MTVAVLKVGGSSTEGVGAAVGELRELGFRVCVVHGAGPQISEEMTRRGLEVRFVGGRRVTTPEALAVVREGLADVNASVCAAIGPDAVPLAGDEVGLEAEPVPELGLVGSAVPSAPQQILSVLASDRVPVVTPLARGPLNVNADEAASALAIGIGASEIRFLTDVPGVFHDGELVDTISVVRAESLVDRGFFDGGIVPKLLAASRAARGGVEARIGTTAVVA
jgi:acetylglutamate kinase